MLQTLADPFLSFRLNQEEHKAAAACSQELAAGGTSLSTGFVDFVNCLRRDTVRKLPLQTPACMKKIAKLANRLPALSRIAMASFTIL